MKSNTVKTLTYKITVVLAVVLFITGTVHAQIATYTGFGGSSTATVGFPNETVSVLQTVGFGSNTLCGSGGISGLTNNGVTVYAPTNAHLFIKITPDPGYMLNVTGFTAGLRRSPSGLTKVRFAYSLDNGTTWIDDLVDHAPTNSGCGTTLVSSWGFGTLPTGITSTTNGIIVALYPYAPLAVGGVIQVNTIVISGSVVPSNTPPTFVGGGSQSLVVCENSPATLINSLMAINDPDVGQTETWTVVSAPSFGTLGGFSTTAPSTGVTVTPGGLTYTPNPGFSGTDAFKIQISDGTATAVTQVEVTVNPTPSPILGSLAVCAGSTTILTDATGGGSWSSSVLGVATIGSSSGVLSGIASGTSTISYIGSAGCAVSAIATVNPLPVGITGISSVCVGATTALTNTTVGGSWSSNDIAIASVGTGSGIVTGVAFGTTTITYILPTGCITTTTVTVNDLPVAISGPSGVCTGSTITLTDATTGGTWICSGAAATIGSTTGVLLGVSPGVTVVTYTSPLGCTTTTPVTVNLTPAAISGATNVCAGATTDLTDAMAGGTWSSSSIAIATVGSGTGTVSGIIPGTTTITYISSAGCIVTTPLTVNTSPAAITGSSAVCTGLITTLSNAVSGGTWSSSLPGIANIGSGTGIVTGVSAGTTTISYTLIGSCTATMVMTVNSSLSAISGTPIVCAGSSTVLSNTIGGGVWSSSNASVASIGLGTGIVTGVSAGTAVISYGGASCAAVGVVVTVNPLPAAITGLNNVCEGFGIYLADATPGGTWNSSVIAVATVSGTGLVAGIVAGTSSISYILTTGCLRTFTITVNPMPTTITGTSVICAGTTTTLSEGISGGTWTSAASSVGSVNTTGLVTGNSSGNTTISYTLPGGCYHTFSMTVNAAPTAISGPANMCTGRTIIFTDGISGGLWSSSASSIASVNPVTGAVSALVPGGVFISYVTAGCPSVTQFVNVSLSPSPLSGITHVCAGLSTTLSNAIPGGSWTSSNPSVTVSPSGVITGLIVGVGTTITYSLSAGCFVTADVYAESLPSAILGVDSVCPGSTIMLSDTTAGGVWSSSDGTIAESIALTGEVRGIVPGTVHITYTLISGCYTSKTFLVSTPLPAFLDVTSTGADTLCHNTTDTLTAHPTNGGSATYIWELFGSYIGSGPNFIYNPAHGDFLTCIMTTHGICASPSVVSKDVVLNVWPLAGPTVEITCTKPDTSAYVGEMYTFYSTVTFGGSNPLYQWYVNHVAVDGATSPVFTYRIYNDNDTIYCRVTSNSPCDTGSYVGSSNTKVVYGQGFLSVGVMQAGHDLSLYPNPNKGSFSLSGSLGIAGDNNVIIEVTDMLGRNILKQATIASNGALNTEIKLDNNITNGIYLLHIHAERKDHVLHFVVEK